MSTLKHVILQDKDQDVGRKLDWSYIEWAENEVVTTGVANAETQTDSGPFEHKGCQTSNPVIMHIDLTRTHSKLRHSSLADTEGVVAPFFQFDRQAPGRISTSPTLRRMRSTRRPLLDTCDPMRMGSTLEERSPESTSSSQSPASPVHRVKSPLAASPLSDGETCHDHQPISSSGRQRSYRSKTLDNGCRSAQPTHSKNFGFPDSEIQEKEHFHNRLQERRRSSVVVSLPGLDVSPGDLFVSNGAADMLNGSNFCGKNPLSLYIPSSKGIPSYLVDQTVDLTQSVQGEFTHFQLCFQMN